nr:1751_t:CDS:2 [Entrophospora candida]
MKCLDQYKDINKEIMDLSEAKRQEIIKSGKYLVDEKNYRHHPESFYTTCILEGGRPQITGDTPQFYADLMQRCWDPNPERRPNANEINSILKDYHHLNQIDRIRGTLTLAEVKRSEIINSEKYLSDKMKYHHHLEAYFMSRPLSGIIEKFNSLAISSNESNEQDSKINNLPFCKYFS